MNLRAKVYDVAKPRGIDIPKGEETCEPECIATPNLIKPPGRCPRGREAESHGYSEGRRKLASQSISQHQTLINLLAKVHFLTGPRGVDMPEAARNWRANVPAEPNLNEPAGENRRRRKSREA